MRLYSYLHHHLLKILISAYLLAAVFPSPGQFLRHFGEKTFAKGSSLEIHFSIPQLLLAFLLFNAGLASRFGGLKNTLLKPTQLLLGAAFNVLAPVVFIGILAPLGKSIWHSPDEIQSLLTGLIIVSSMPIAGASTTWAQTSGANPSLILGLVTLTTLLSPVTTPWFFKTLSPLLTGDYAEDILEIATQGGLEVFLLLSVVVPSFLGMTCRSLLGEKAFLRIQPAFKLSGLAVLILLNYLNATAALPTVLSNPDWDFLAMLLASTLLLCLLSFLGGWFLPILTRASDPDRKAITFGLGMNNNGMGLVMASSSMTDHPLIMLPIIFYNLGQQIVAGYFTSWFSRKFKD